MPYIVNTVFLELLLSGHVRTMYKCSVSASIKSSISIFLGISEFDINSLLGYIR